jgi:hypothetical protein
MCWANCFSWEGKLMGQLTSAEIRHLQDMRAKNLAARAKPTTATAPWPEPGAKAPLALVAAKCLTEALNVSDLRYMALAMLQMQDTIAELRERVRVLENEGSPRGV